ncbi:Exodeoxyribonuclease 7 small subunit [Stieleria bergensis]|uniref:Exodeoxyribonuclease 7 small subunit n=1 Tax=Stieleria bergensis TaxID=2528025 RepID=A0A517T016_9BACT|nr:Exodeoxyribonuclease 7 small subunit [Planctomycetes bacterium SV_7m_r]
MAKKKTARQKANDDDLDFETALGEVQQVVHELEDGELDLTQSLARYEQGIAMLRHCHGMLKQAEAKITLLTEVDADSNPVTEPIDIEGDQVSDSPQKSAGGLF